MTATRLVVPTIVAALAMGCAVRGPHRGEALVEDDGGATDPLEASAPEASAPETSLTHDAATDSAPPPACAPGADLVYVASEERNIYSFDPTTATFTLLGNIDCAGGAYVNSMAIDRTATAWINYADGSLWKAGTHNPSCTATGFIPDQQGVGMFGMGFSAKVPGSLQDTLFIDDLSGGGLGYIDTSTMTLLRFGPFLGSLANSDCELTGTADGKLFGFFTGGPYGDAGLASVADIDPNTEGAVKQWMLPGVDTGSDWAFAAWGGDFYLFTADRYNMTDPYTTVTRFRPSDGSLTVLASSIGFRVVGAGSSTCAPTMPTQ